MATSRSISALAPGLDNSAAPRARGCLTTKIATDETAMDERVRNALRDRL